MDQRLEKFLEWERGRGRTIAMFGIIGVLLLGWLLVIIVLALLVGGAQ